MLVLHFQTNAVPTVLPPFDTDAWHFSSISMQFSLPVSLSSGCSWLVPPFYVFGQKDKRQCSMLKRK